jgi:dolichyl-phosphate beta-glucosyltransferase
LSILLPAYNEVHRIGDTLCRYHTFLSRSKLWQNQSDIWVIDDGSNDGTSEFVYEFAQTVRIQQPHDDDDVYPREEFNALPTIHCVTLETNQGKGAAVARGLLELTAMTAALPHQQQRIVLVADADGSGDIACLNDMWFELSKIIMKTVASMDERNNVTTLRHEFAPASVTNNDYIDDDTISLMLLPAALVVGRRESSDISFLRWWLRMGFRWTVRTACGDLGVTDSQCGFKLMTLTAATCSLYQDLHMPRWTHDVEVLVRARAWNISVAEHAVPWKDQDGSKLVQPTQLLQLVSIIWIMLWQVLRLRWEYDVTGNWRTKL